MLPMTTSAASAYDRNGLSVSIWPLLIVSVDPPEEDDDGAPDDAAAVPSAEARTRTAASRTAAIRYRRVLWTRMVISAPSLRAARTADRCPPCGRPRAGSRSGHVRR